MTGEGLRATGATISAGLALCFAIGALVMVGHPHYSPWGWIGVGLLGSLSAYLWESTKRIGR